MKNYFRYFILVCFISLMFPLVSNAATFTLEEKESNENVVVYDIVYNPEDTPVESINMDLTKTNNNLEYSVLKNENGGTVGTCDSFPCNLGLDLVKSTTTIASITITNPTETTQTTVIELSGDITSEQKTITLKAKPVVTTTVTTTTTQAIIPNNNLSALNISVGVMDKTFSKDITDYNITEIKDTVNSITLTPTCETECTWEVTCPLGECSVTNPTKNARVSLQTGANKISVVVKSIDNSINKTYVLNVYRGEIETSSAYLSDIKIADVELSPKFDSMTNDYTATVGLDIDELDMDITPEDPEANIVIKGNEDLIEGENTITVTVTSSDGENKQVYTIIVTKEEIIDEDEVEKTTKPVVSTKVEKKNNNLWLIIGLSVLALILIVVVFIVIFRKNKKGKKNDKNNKSGGSKVQNKTASDLLDENPIEKENTESLNILDETRKQMMDEPKQDIDEALDDLMMTKRLELGDLDIYS